MRSSCTAIVIALAMSGGCGRIAFDALGDANVGEPDVAIDAVPLGPWSTPTLVVLPTIADDDDPSLTDDLLELYFNRGGSLIYRSTRATTSAGWSDPAVVAELNDLGSNTMPEVSPDGLSMSWSSTRGGGAGGLDIYRASRALRTDPWGAAVNEAMLNSLSNDYGGSQTSSGLRAVISSTRGGTFDIYESVRTSTLVSWQAPIAMPNLATAGHEDEPFITQDGLTLYYTGPGDDLHVTTRSSLTDPFPAGEPIAELLSTGMDLDAWVSADGRYIMFASDRGGSSRLYEATR